MSAPFRTIEDYELFLYGLPERYPSIRRSTLVLARRGATLARVAGEMHFEHDLRLVVRERLVYDRLPVAIDSYGYEIWRGDEKLCWYDSQPHPDDPALQATHPRRSRVGTMSTATATPAAIYLAGLSTGSQQGMRQALDVIASILRPGTDADTYPWHEVTYRDSMAARIALIDRYKPASVNKMLSALRGVLKQAWRLGLMDADAYRRAADVENVRASNLLSGRALSPAEVARLFTACIEDRSVKGARDATLLAVFYGCGLRRGELVRLDVADFDPDDCSIRVHGKRRKQRTAYLSEHGRRYVCDWLDRRGSTPGALFCPVNQCDEVRIRGKSGQRRRGPRLGAGHRRPHLRSVPRRRHCSQRRSGDRETASRSRPTGATSMPRRKVTAPSAAGIATP